MNRSYKIRVAIGLSLAIIIFIAVTAVLFVNNHNSKIAENQIANPAPSTSTNTSGNTSSTKQAENTGQGATAKKKEYTGYCAIYGKYRQRYVECTGDYDPAAKERAEAKAKECNESSNKVSGCKDRYQ